MFQGKRPAAAADKEKLLVFWQQTNAREREALCTFSNAVRGLTVTSDILPCSSVFFLTVDAL